MNAAELAVLMHRSESARLRRDSRGRLSLVSKTPLRARRILANQATRRGSRQRPG